MSHTVTSPTQVACWPGADDQRRPPGKRPSPTEGQEATTILVEGKEIPGGCVDTGGLLKGEHQSFSSSSC